MATINDKAVLQTIFNPNTPFGDIPGQDAEQEELIQDNDSKFDAELLEQAKYLELQGISAAESGDISTALEKFNQAIHLLPDRASGYNNRAQTLRLKGNISGAMEDLSRAIELSNGKGHTACQAFVQRGLIHRLQRKDDAAREDFQKAACLGSTFAKQQMILLNPYAAICNQMLADMIQKLRNPDSQGFYCE
ncbi:tetratricopeptide repeat protein 36 [Protopterus annectens]|uniref:tetratricopeptide repeat protein 36 n=1 Tax=Protopterus annectens TaxID=7888 RepID=UPI001CFA4B6F|nr:tetratricopeptide repeat protein 36 [Protopterus annectens]